ncbi:Hypothetical predicted protein [Lecanosticta acicola]|uniref:Uncharacterized protein n=1 Tax=Lecanosticta acicola TaxID=111012 RepID=A0AAI8YSG3_9PEZI|nr:Hypothetical predicted protein [Lecanosticta acicola]
MNKFLKKKAADGPAFNDDDLAISTPTSPVLNPTSKKSSNSRWKKNNKKQPEPKPQLDLTAALPSTDDFRTSLIMPSLSTRFSMLREQDDPKSLLGKASDDSVLQSRRKSRMNDFGFGVPGLADIAEVASIHGSVRPPFAHESRQHSLVSEEGYSSEADNASHSVMSRARPGEGNILFGGRQKIYKIPTGGATSTRSLGRLVYEDDVGMSAFQKYRQKEREHDESQFPRSSDESQAFDFGLEPVEPRYHDDSGLDTLPNDSAKDLSHSPSLSSYDKKRSTTSSTARSEARSSTAATSVASQPLTSAQPSPAQTPATMVSSGNTAAPSPTPGMSLERSNTKQRRLYEQGLDQHMQEQQTSALTRLNSIQRQRALSGKKSPPFLHGAKSASNLQDRSAQPFYALGPASPPPTAPLPQLKTLGSIRHPHSGTNSPSLSNPQSPIDLEQNDVWTRALEPGDRGKATAMGAFNKPAHAFDEKQYLERQKALQRSNSNAVMKNKATPQAAAGAPQADQQEEPSSVDAAAAAARARSESVPKKHEPTKAYNVFQNAANQLPKPPQPTSAAPVKASLPDTHRTFFGNISASEDEEEDGESSIAQSFSEYGYGIYQPQRWQPTPLQPVSEHPALRSEHSKTTWAEEDEEMEPRLPKQAASAQSLKIDPAKSRSATSPPLDSPTLGPQAQPLNGMVHHLRQRSNQSSLYPNDDRVPRDDDVPDVPEVPWNSKTTDSYGQTLGAGMDNHSRRGSYAISNPWDLDEPSFTDYSHASRSSLRPYDEHSGMDMASNRGSETSSAQEGVSETRPTMVREDSEISLLPGPEPAWQRELRKQHVREASTATQQERDAFANELAARRNAIQENIKSMVERDTHSRGTSPAPSASNAMRAFGMLRLKNSRESMAHVHDQPPKALKNLAHGMEGGRPRNDSSPRIFMPTAQHPAFKADGAGPSRDMDAMQAERALATSRSFQSSEEHARSRSNSAATTGRSRSRTGPYRDDLEKAMVEGRGSSAAARTPDICPFAGASPDMMSRSSDEDKSPFDTKNNSRIAQNGPSPVTLAPNVYAPGRPVPMANPYSQNQTPPLEGSSPSLGTEVYSPIMPSSGKPGHLLRKKTISKHEISEPTLISSTSNVDTVDLPSGASLKNGMEDAPPIPPINPRRRTTRKIFRRGRSDSNPHGDHEPKATASDPALNISPKRNNEYPFPPSSVVRLPSVRDADNSPAMPQNGFNRTDSPDLSVPPVPQRPVTAPLDGGMF